MAKWTMVSAVPKAATRPFIFCTCCSLRADAVFQVRQTTGLADTNQLVHLGFQRGEVGEDLLFKVVHTCSFPYAVSSGLWVTSAADWRE